MTEATEKQQVNQMIDISGKDLPICCPRPGADGHGLHPRVFISFDKDGVGVCPYCGAGYKLTGPMAGH